MAKNETEISVHVALQLKGIARRMPKSRTGRRTHKPQHLPYHEFPRQVHYIAAAQQHKQADFTSTALVL